MARHTGHVSVLLENDGASFLQPLTHLRDLGIDLLTALPYSGRKKRRPATTRSLCQALCLSVYIMFIHWASPASNSNSETSCTFILSAHCKKVLVRREGCGAAPVSASEALVVWRSNKSDDRCRFRCCRAPPRRPCVADGAPFYLLEELNTLGGFEELLQAEQGRPRHMVLQVHLSGQHSRTREARLPNFFLSLRTPLRQEELASAVDQKLVLQNQKFEQIRSTSVFEGS